MNHEVQDQELRLVRKLLNSTVCLGQAGGPLQYPGVSTYRRYKGDSRLLNLQQAAP